MNEALLTKYLRKVYKEFLYCECCQPYDSEDKDIVWIFGRRIELDEYLSELNIPDRHFEEIANSLSCPNCGSEIGLYSDIGLETMYEKEFDKKLKEINKVYLKQFTEFQNYIYKYPYLGLNHKFGRKIQSEIVKLKTIDIKDEIWYRARSLSDSRVLVNKDMLAPSAKKVQINEGRYNHYGQSHLYLGQYEETCIKEILKDVNSICWMQKINIKYFGKILDISEMVYEYSGGELPITFAALIYKDELIKKVDPKVSWKPEYFIPRFVADIAKSKGYKGIKYPSAVSAGSNLVIFNPIKKNYSLIDDPYVYKAEKLDPTKDIF